MKKLLLAGVSMCVGLGAFAVTSANAADIVRRRPPPPPAPVVAPPYNWTGFYVGINGGGGFGNSDINNTFGTTGLDVSGGMVGGTLGYNYQTGNLVLGIEGDGGWSGIKGSTNGAACPTATCDVRNNWLATLRGRVGYAYGRFMPYVTGGVAFGDIDMTPAGFTGETEGKAGWTVGGGIEAALSGPWTAKLEYLYVDLGDATCSAANCGVTTTTSFSTNIVRAGINYRF